MKVLVTGATGFIGHEVVRQLHAAGHQVHILARDPSNRSSTSLVRETQAEVSQGDIQTPDTLVPALQGREAVLHLVGIISEAGRSTFENVHVLGTKHVLEAALKCGVNRLIHMSALGTRVQAVSRYHQTKWAAEELVRASAVRATILRPSLVYGPGDHFVNLFAKMARWSPVIPVIGRSTALFQPVMVECVAQAFVRALDVDRSIGRTYDLCGPERLTLPQIIDEILAATGRRRLKLRLGPRFAAIQAIVMEAVFRRLLGKPSPLNRDQLLMLREDNIGDPVPANRDFGLTPTSFADGIRAYVQ